MQQGPLSPCRPVFHLEAFALCTVPSPELDGKGQSSFGREERVCQPTACPLGQGGTGPPTSPSVCFLLAENPFLDTIFIFVLPVWSVSRAMLLPSVLF